MCYLCIGYDNFKWIDNKNGDDVCFLSYVIKSLWDLFYVLIGYDLVD